MIYVGIDVSKDKHDCFITNSDSEILFNPFTIQNNLEGFDELFNKICSVTKDFNKVKVGLEVTGHYTYNLLGYLIDKGFPTFVINPLHTNLYRKSLSLRQTKTDKVDARTIASMLMSDVNLKSYSDTSYHNEELKSLTRYRFHKEKERAKLKSSVSRLINILFPELEKLVPSLHMPSVYALLSEFPGASHIASLTLQDWQICSTKPLRDATAKTLLSLFVRLQETLSVLLCPRNLWNSNTPSNLFKNWILRSMKSNPKSSGLWMKKSIILFLPFPVSVTAWEQ